MILKAESVENLNGEQIELLNREIPLNDCFFSLSAAILKNKKIVFLSGENESGENETQCGVMLYDVLESNGEKVFFISALALELKKCGYVGHPVYEWIENQARSLGCKKIVFDSIRRGMLYHARGYDWKIVNIRYQKEL